MRGLLKKLPPTELAGLLEELAVEDQVIAFRILPRGVAADVFEYLSLEAQEQLLKAMAPA